jgi:hypothetical protein
VYLVSLDRLDLEFSWTVGHVKRWHRPILLTGSIVCRNATCLHWLHFIFMHKCVTGIEFDFSIVRCDCTQRQSVVFYLFYLIVLIIIHKGDTFYNYKATNNIVFMCKSHYTYTDCTCEWGNRIQIIYICVTLLFQPKTKNWFFRHSIVFLDYAFVLTNSVMLLCLLNAQWNLFPNYLHLLYQRSKPGLRITAKLATKGVVWISCGFWKMLKIML